jgi:LuxR family transcriptional regulator, quorum-sensing system regulator BjaR1
MYHQNIPDRPHNTATECLCGSIDIGAKARLLNTFTAIEGGFRATSLTQLHSILRGAVTSFGIDYFEVDEVRQSQEARPVDALFGDNHRAWSAHYLERQHYRHDSIVNHVRAHISPVLWRDLLVPGRISESEKRVFDEAGDFGLNDGFCIPICKADGRVQTVACTSKQPLDLCLQDQSTIRLLALYYVSLGERLWQSSSRREATNSLTPMQRECLAWVRAGKTNWEISAILGISERTVKFHLKAACVRLGVYNRTQAVVEASVRGEIELGL